MFLSFMAAAIAGILISRGARVWLLFVIVLGTMVVALAAGYSAQAGVGETIGHALTIGVGMQIGYGLGVFGSLAVGSRLAITRGPVEASFYSARRPDQNDIARR